MGRTRIYKTNADRQRAYRVRKAEARKAQEKSDRRLTFVPYKPHVPANGHLTFVPSTPDGESAA